MLKKYHIDICKRTLESSISDKALKAIIKANIAQDCLRGQFGHPEFHFDNNAFDSVYSYIKSQRQIIWNSIALLNDPEPAWKAFGKLTHATQDFYAHSNYIRLWVDMHKTNNLPPIAAVEPLRSEIINHPDLRSGQVHLWDWLVYIPGFHWIAPRILPPDSHTHMNLDSPSQGQLFHYAFEAASKRTRIELSIIEQGMDNQEYIHFIGR